MQLYGRRGGARVWVGTAADVTGFHQHRSGVVDRSTAEHGLTDVVAGRYGQMPRPAPPYNPEQAALIADLSTWINAGCPE